MADPSDRTRPIRFGLQVNPRPEEIDRIGREAEAAGFDVISVADHIGTDLGAPLITLARLAGVTASIDLGTMVLNNDMRNPVQLAWEAATLQRLSGGRFELGLGAGHSRHEYTETGIGFDRPTVRKQRLAEAVEIIARLFQGETVTFHGEHYRVVDARLAPIEAPPILVGGNGTALLRHAAHHADIIGLQGLGRTLEDGHQHDVKFGIDHLEEQLAVIDAAADPGRRPALNALVQVCEITDDREAVLAGLVERIGGLTIEAARATPYFAVGTVDEIASQMLAAGRTWGIDYFTVRTMDLAPVIARVRRLERESAPDAMPGHR